MAWKTFDFICINKKCTEYNTKKEIMVKDSERNNRVCESCGEILMKGFSMGAIRTADNQGKIKI